MSWLYTLPAKPGVVISDQPHVCGEHADGYPEACGRPYYAPSGVKELHCPTCRETPEYREWHRQRKRSQERRYKERQAARKAFHGDRR